jgi:hypothetical protein
MPYITGAAGTGTGRYFQDNDGNPRLLVSGEDWGLLANGGAWNSGDYQTTYDNYFSQRQAQGYTAVEVSMFSYPGSGQVFPFTDGRDWDGVWPFTSTSNPSSGLNSTFWTRRDYFLNSALNAGITVFVNAGTPLLSWGAGDMCATWTTQQWTDYGTAMAGRYAAQPNLIWMLGDDYFNNLDTQLSAWLTALRAGGDTHLVGFQSYQETTGRTDIPGGTAIAWGSSNAQLDCVYTYNFTYPGIEVAYTGTPESSHVPVVWMDGFFLNSGTTGITDLNLVRRMVWWAISSGSRGWQVGDNTVWPWDSGAAAQITSNQWYTSQAPAIASLYGGLPGWHLLVPDTSSALVTAGRGTHGTAIISGGGGTPYASNTDAYVTASKTPDGSLAVIYMSHASSITINQSLMTPGYGAYWVDPASGAKTATTAGSSYNSAGLGTNSVGDADWALVLAAPPYATWTVP